MFYQAYDFNQVLCWELPSGASTTSMFTGCCTCTGCVGVVTGDYGCGIPDTAGLQAAVTAWCANPATAAVKYGNITTWITSEVTSMANLIYIYCNGDTITQNTFNEDISRWDVSSATSFANTFRSADAFNQDLSKWTVSRSTTFQYMFSQAYDFNQVLCWELPTGATTLDMFTSCCTCTNCLGQVTGYNDCGCCHDNTELQTAVTAWCANPATVARAYGNITTWNTSEVTSMEDLIYSCAGSAAAPRTGTRGTRLQRGSACGPPAAFRAHLGRATPGA